MAKYPLGYWIDSMVDRSTFYYPRALLGKLGLQEASQALEHILHNDGKSSFLAEHGTNLLSNILGTQEKGGSMM